MIPSSVEFLVPLHGDFLCLECWVSAAFRRPFWFLRSDLSSEFCWPHFLAGPPWCVLCQARPDQLPLLDQGDLVPGSCQDCTVLKRVMDVAPSCQWNTYMHFELKRSGYMCLVIMEFHIQGSPHAASAPLPLQRQLYELEQCPFVATTGACTA